MKDKKMVRGSVVMRVKKRYVAIGIIVSFILICVIGVKYITSEAGRDKLKYMINKSRATVVETEEYKSGFMETTYKNYKIKHNKNIESTLPMIFDYLDKIESRIEEVFGYIPKEELTIQIDYENDVFNARNSIGESSEEANGYYMPVIKTIYMPSENPFRDIIMDSTDFSESLSHEYVHHALFNFISENNINEEYIPHWFHEGVAEYLSNDVELGIDKIEYISLKKLNSDKEWVDANNEINSPYPQSMYAIYKMIDLKGENIIKDIIINCKENTFDDSFKEIMEVSLDDFDEFLKTDIINYNNLYKEINTPEPNIELKTKCLEEYIKINEDDINAYIALATFYSNYRDFNTAEEFLKESIEKYPEVPLLWTTLAVLYENNNMMDLAEECYLKGEKLIK